MFSDFMHTRIHTSEKIVHEPNAFEVEMDIEKLERHKSAGIDQIPAEFIQASGRNISPCDQFTDEFNLELGGIA